MTVLSRAGGALVRRLLFATVALLVLPTQGHAAPAPDGDTDVTVVETSGVYHVTARFHVQQPLARVAAVLTDYERLPRFMPEIKTSIVRERTAERTLVEQEAVSRVLLFSRRVHLILDVRREGDGLAFTDLCGRSFVTYAGAWRLVADETGTSVTYQLTAQPRSDVPSVVVKRVVKSDATTLLNRLRTEFAAEPR
jgi:carbon monoxide dehydrogenase subunit G